MARAIVTKQYLYENYIAGRVIRPVKLKKENKLGWGEITLVNTETKTKFPFSIDLGLCKMVCTIEINYMTTAKWDVRIYSGGVAAKNLIDDTVKGIKAVLNDVSNFEFDWINFNEGEDKNTEYSSIVLTRNRGTNAEGGA